jgi:hypothetical protein
MEGLEKLERHCLLAAALHYSPLVVQLQFAEFG